MLSGVGVFVVGGCYGVGNSGVVAGCGVVLVGVPLLALGVMLFALGSCERRPLGLGQDCVEIGPSVERELKIGPILFQSWSMRATSGGARAGQELVSSGSIVAHAWPQSGPRIDLCCAIHVPKGGSGVGKWLVKSGPQAGHERGPHLATPQTWGIAITSVIATTASSNTTPLAICNTTSALHLRPTTGVVESHCHAGSSPDTCSVHP